MQHEYTISGMTCSGCASTVEKALLSVEKVTDVKISLDQSMAIITMSSHVPTSVLQQALSAYPTYQLSDRNSHPKQPLWHAQPNGAPSFWDDIRIWKRASLNTLNCLIGCSIGDFAMIVFLQAYYPATPMITQMILAILAGLITSVLLETVLLKYREHFTWGFALQSAFAMSFLSMVGMEIAMNTTDFMITGGKAAFENPMYWTALAVAMVAGFLVPLPYNYYKLKKFNQACH